MSLVRSFFTVSGFTLISRVMGFIRDILIAAIMGAGPLTEVFLVAFKLPNFFRRLFAEGAFNAAFVPMFSGMLTKDGKDKAKDFAERILAVLLFSLFIFVLLMEITMPWVMHVLAPGFVENEGKFELAIYLTRITFPYLIFISLVSLFAGVLNSVGRFAAVAATPILLNLCLIGALLYLTEFTKTPAHALSIGVAIAGLVQFIWLFVNAARSGMRLKFRFPRMSDQVRKFLKRMAPGVIGAGVVQINLWVDIIIGTFIPSAIAYLYYADRVNQLPLSIIGTAMGVALLPMLSKQIRDDKLKDAIKTQNRALELVLFFTLPATAALIIISHTVISVLFERGAFTSVESIATSYGLIAYAVGLPAFVMVKVFTSTFFASGDTKTPVKIAVICLVTNIIFNISFIWLFLKLGFMPHIGLALATSLSSWINLVLLYIILIKRDKFSLDVSLKVRFAKIILATILMSAIVFFAQETILAEGINEIASLVLIVAAGMGSYLALSYMLNIFNKDDLRRLFSRR